ncbi:MAG TPA: RNA methyltransferase [Myxococcaceae bacterium]|nr:RNA methyltransferase [Myxococcaceae bacterium]
MDVRITERPAIGQPGDVERVFVQCLPGLEQVLTLEATALGRPRHVDGGVELEGGPGLHADAVLGLRTAEAVLLRLLEVGARRWEEVEAALRTVVLDAVVEAGNPVALETSLRMPGAPARGALPRLLARLWSRPVEQARAEARDGEATRLVLRVAEGTASLSADVSGTLLHRRGWRQELSRAPMRETLAAGVLALAGYAPQRPLWDPVCGSGTLIIEAALVGRSVAPGLGRSFAAEAWPVAARVDWAGRRQRLRALVRPRVPAPILGSDLNAGALGTARRNARRAGVLGDLRLERLDVARATPGPLRPGLVVGNLPYGLRVGAREGLEAFDAAVARALTDPFRAWRRALLVDDPARLVRAGGRAPDRVHRLVNGGIPVVLGIWETDDGTPVRGV